MFKLHNNNNEILVVNPDFTAIVTDKWFDKNHWRKQGLISGTASGRGNTVFFKHNDKEYALRHFRRGGKMRFLVDRYVFTGLRSTRAYRELTVTALLFNRGLPTVLPVAVRIRRKKIFYTADIITVKIDAVPLLEYVTQNPADLKVWDRSGKMLARFHQAGLNHPDINLRNILVNRCGEVFLIDFDKCALNSTANKRKKNLRRLIRSLNKEFSFATGQEQDILVKSYRESFTIR